MKKHFFLLLSLCLLVLASCKKEKPINPFATPEGCVKEYLNAEDSCDVARMLSCFSYDPKYESIIREGLQEKLDKNAKNSSYYNDSTYYRNDSVVLKETYPNTAVVTVYYTFVSNGKDDFSDNYDLNLVKDSTNWKLEARLSYSIESSFY